MANPLKRPGSEGLDYQAWKKPRPLSEIETRVNEFRKIICDLKLKDSESSEFGQALFTWIASNPVNDEILKNIFSNLELSTEALEFQNGDTVHLPLCLWNAHGSYFQALFNKNMKKTPLEDTEDLGMLEIFKICLKRCTSASLLDQTNWQELFMLAHKYQVLWLIKECEEFLCKNKNLFQFSDLDQQKLLCFAVEYNLSKLLRTCLHHFIHYDVKVTTDPVLFQQIQKAAYQFSLTDLKLYVSSLLNDCLWIDPSTDQLWVELESSDVEERKGEIRKCLSGYNLWHSPQIFLSITPNSELRAETLDFVLKGNRILTGLDLLVDLEKIQIITEMMQENRTLKHLALRTDPDISSSDCDSTFAFFINFLTEHASLETLILWDCGLGTKSAAALQTFLSSNPYLVSFTLGGNDLDKEMILALQKGCANNTNLTELSILSCSICAEGSLIDFLRSLELNPTLKKLNLGQPFNIDELDEDPIPSLLEMLKKNKTLETLALENLDDEVIENILEGLATQECALKEIVFKDCALEGKEIVHNIFESQKEKTIRLIFQNPTINQEAFNQLQKEQQDNPHIDFHFSGQTELEEDILIGE